MGLANDHQTLSANPPILDFDIHGIVGIRVIDPATDDTAGIVEQLGIYSASLNRQPDITIRFKKELSPPTLTYLGLNSVGFTEEGFYILDKRDGRVKAQVPLNHIGNQCEIVCQSGIGSIPMLFDIIRLTFLRKNYIPLHGSAFYYKGNGILTAGWSKGGKTESLLAFVNHGADYIADEWVILSSDGQSMFGIPIPVTLWEWQFKYIPTLLPKLPISQKFLFRSIHAFDAIHKALKRERLRRVFPVDILGRVLPYLKQGLNLSLLPQRLFKNHFYQRESNLDKLFLVMSHSEARISVAPCDSMEVAQRMAISNAYEQMDFFQYYQAFKFAFPQVGNEFLEGVMDLQRSLLYRALSGKETYQVLHPYPVPFEELFNHMQPFCEGHPMERNSL
jgi:hypothetical protein